MHKSKIVILGDSTAMFRPSEGVDFNSTYSYKLAYDGHIVVDKSIRAATSDTFSQCGTLEDHFQIDADYYVLQFGICDCARRIFSKQEKAILDFMSAIPVFWRLSSAIYTYCRKRRHTFTKLRQIQNVPFERFSENYKKILNEIQTRNPKVKGVFVVNILYPGEFMLRKSYKILDLIQKYNSYTDKLINHYKNIKIIDLYTFTKLNPSYVLADGHHFSKEVHTYVYDQLRELISADTE